MTRRYAAPPTSVRIPPGGGDARSGGVPPAPDYRARLRDLYARRTATTRLDPDTVRTRGDAVSRSLTPRYEPRLKSDLEAAKPTPSPAPTPRSGSPRVTPQPRTTPTPRPSPAPRTTPAPTEPRVTPRDPRGGSPRTGAPGPQPSPGPRVTPISDRYRVPGRQPRLTPSPIEPGSPRTTPRVGPDPVDPTAPRSAPRTPGANPEPRSPGLRPRTSPPTADPIPTPGGPNRSPRLTPVGPTDIVGGRGRRGGGGGNDPNLNPRGRGGRGGGLGPRFSDRWYDYNSWSVAGSYRYLYGSYHWSGHCAAFWPTTCGWGSYWYPYQYCGSWYRYWYNCRSSFVVYWNSRYPRAARVAWWWPSYCYLPGSWFGFSGFSSWSSDYVDWSYVPSTTYVVREVVREPAVVAADDGAGAEAPAEDSPEALAERHVKLGDYYFRRGRYEEAAESYVRALAYAPDDGALHFVLADALFAQGDYHYAAYMIGRGLKLDAGLANAVADKREFYDDPAEFEKQVDTLREYLAEKPYDAAAFLVLGYNLRFSDRSAEATKAFERVLEIDPGNEAARAFLEGLAAGAEAGDAGAAPAERSDKK